MADMQIRTATTAREDEEFICEMLAEAVAWRPNAARQGIAEILANPDLALYVEGWGRPNDVGFIAEQNRRPVGAAWRRSFTTDRQGYGFISPEVPELTIAVRQAMRGLGVGSALLHALLDEARQAQCAALSLSVEEENPAIDLYERLGFARVGRVQNAWTLRLDINPA